MGLLLSVKDNIEKDDYSYFYSLSNVYVQQEQYDSAIYYAEYIIKNDSDLYGQASAYLSLYEVAKNVRIGRKLWLIERNMTYMLTVYMSIRKR